MAKVTEQDLIKLGFKLKRDGGLKWYELKSKHKIFKKISIEISHLCVMHIWVDRKCIAGTNKLTHANLDLFIKFAKGEKL